MPHVFYMEDIKCPYCASHDISNVFLCREKLEPFKYFYCNKCDQYHKVDFPFVYMDGRQDKWHGVYSADEKECDTLPEMLAEHLGLNRLTH